MLREITQRLLLKENIGFVEIQSALDAILQGRCEAVGIAGFLTALAAKGETAEEVAGMAQALRDHAVGVTPQSDSVIDIVGTGGDGSHTFNISTTAALVAAGAGAKVAKHGNRAITSQCGSADILAHLGVKIDATPAVIARCIDECGIGFMFAPAHHPAMKHVQPVRKALGFRTVFNILGPLANPARVKRQFTGAARPELVPIMAEALQRLGCEKAMVVHGAGMDELTTAQMNDVAILENGAIHTDKLHPGDLGLQPATPDDLAGGSLDDNAAITRGIIDGSDTTPRRDIVLFNAAGALIVAGVATDFPDGIEKARQAITGGQANKVLQDFVALSQS